MVGLVDLSSLFQLKGSCDSMNSSLVAEFGSGSLPFFLLPWPLVQQVPAVALPVPTQTGGEGVGWEGELRNSGLAPLTQRGSQAARRGRQPEPSTMLTGIAALGKEESLEPQLKPCSAAGTTQVFCLLPPSPAALGQCFPGLWAVAQN